MDKSDFKKIMGEIDALAERGDFEGAARMADEVDWRRVKNIRTLCTVAEIYEANRRLEDSLRLLKLAYRRSGNSKTVAYRLAEMYIRMGSFDEAERSIREFKQLSPHDMSRYILLYKLAKAKKQPLDDQIAILRAYKEREYTERWSYELARLYHQNGQDERCVAECDDLILWFSEGKFVIRAMELKMEIQPLTPEQEDRYRKEQERIRLEAEEAERKAREEAEAKKRAAREAEEARVREIADRQRREAALRLGEETSRVKPGSTVAALDKLDVVADQAVTVASSAAHAPNVSVPVRQTHSDDNPTREQQRLASSFREVVADVRGQQPEGDEKKMDWNTWNKDGGETPGVKLADFAAWKTVGTQNDQAPLGEAEATPAAGRAGAERLSGRSFLEEMTRVLAGDTKPVPVVTGAEAPVSGASETVVGNLTAPADNLSAAAGDGAAVSAGGFLTAAGGMAVVAAGSMAETAGDAPVAAGADLATAFEDTASIPAGNPAASAGDGALPTGDTPSIPAGNPAASAGEGALPTGDTPSIPADNTASPTGDTSTVPAGDLSAPDGNLSPAPAGNTSSIPSGDLTAAGAVGVTAAAVGVAAAGAMGIAAVGAAGAAAAKAVDTAASAVAVTVGSLTASGDDTAAVPAVSSAGSESQNTAAEGTSLAAGEEKSQNTAAEATPYAQAGETTKEQPKEAGARTGTGRQTAFDILQANGFEFVSFADGTKPEDTKSITVDLGIEPETPVEEEKDDKRPVEPRPLDATERELLSYFSKIPGIPEQVTMAMADVFNHSGERTSSGGNILIMGRPGCGKSRLAEGLILCMSRDLDIKAVKSARLTAQDMNRKDAPTVISKMAGGFLVIEAAGALRDDVVEQMSEAMEFRTDGLVVILEDEKSELRTLLDRHPLFREKFTSEIVIPVFTNDELVMFAKTYALERGYKLDEMAVLALYTEIGENQLDLEPVTVGMVRMMVDRAINRTASHRFGRRRSIDTDGRIILREKDFDY